MFIRFVEMMREVPTGRTASPFMQRFTAMTFAEIVRDAEGRRIMVAAQKRGDHENESLNGTLVKSMARFYDKYLELRAFEVVPRGLIHDEY